MFTKFIIATVFTEVMVWCAVNGFKIIGHFFKSKGGETVTVTAEHYCEMIRKMKPQFQ